VIYIYVDNFRGFGDTFIPIKDVNFLVGENSTGKTSILSLINVLFSPDFWFEQRFNSGEIKLGNFRDIVSIASSNKKYFKIGIVNCGDKVSPNNLETINAFLLKFVEEDGLPVISRYSYVRKQDEVKIAFSKKLIRYKIAKITYSNNICKDVLSTFKKWASEEDVQRGFTTIKERIPFGPRGFLSYVPNLIDSQVPGEDTRKSEFSVRLPNFPRLAWIGPIRSKPRRTHDELKPDFTPEGDQTPYLIKRILGNQNQKIRESFLRFIENFGAKSGLFSSISIKEFGKYSDSPFRLDIILAKNPLSIDNVGYGVSQSLPVVVELFARPKAFWYAIQQPEVHLHPRAQAALGDIFYYFATKEKKKFLIETHSEYMVDRYRMNYRKHREDNNLDSQVLFFERTNGGNIVHSIGIDKSGKYSENQPKSFQDFFLKENLSLLELE